MIGLDKQAGRRRATVFNPRAEEEHDIAVASVIAREEVSSETPSFPRQRTVHTSRYCTFIRFARPTSHLVPKWTLEHVRKMPLGGDVIRIEIGGRTIGRTRTAIAFAR